MSEEFNGELEPKNELPETHEPTKESKTERRSIRLSLKSFILSSVALVLVAVMVTYAVCSGAFQKKLSEIYLAGQDTTDPTDPTDEQQKLYTEKDAIDFLLDRYFYGEIDRDAITDESLKAYIAATGDIYAAYYTEEELKSLAEDAAGRMQGIGINIINSTVLYGGVEYLVLKIINVIKNSPALAAGLRVGDMIFAVGAKSDGTLVENLGYNEALNQLKGPSGTKAQLVVLRKNGEQYEEKEFSIERKEVITSSVYSRVSTLDSRVGIVKITEFSANTPVQFEEAIEELKNSGCNKFVMDLRYNPGGALDSVRAILSYFLSEGDVYIRTQDKSGIMVPDIIAPVRADELHKDYANCEVKAEDIGKYKNLNMTVLCNEYTASAAELFTATFKDYGLGEIIGTTTYGKGKMQTTYSLAPFGLKGAVKFTTSMYYSAKSPGYDGIGIEPDHKVELSSEAREYNIYDLPDALDDQLLEAIKYFK